MSDKKIKTLLITGSARGLGRSLALDLASPGVNIIINYRHSMNDAKELLVRLEERGAKAMALQADVTRENQVKQMFRQIETSFDGVDILINNVGEFLYKELPGVTGQEWQNMLDSNLNSCFYCCQAALPYMRSQQWGRIINIGLANIGVKAYKNVVPYAIAKTGVHILTKSLAEQEAGNGITVNVLAPGLMDNGKLSEEQIANQDRIIPAGRSGNAQDLLGAVKYLSGPQAGYVTGSEIIISGGWGL